MIADLKPETLASVIDALVHREEDIAAAAEEIDQINRPLAQYIAMAFHIADTDDQRAYGLGVLSALIAVRKTELGKELQRLVVVGADTEPDHAERRDPDGAAPGTARESNALE